MRKYSLCILSLCAWQWVIGMSCAYGSAKITIPDSLQSLHFEVNGVEFDMQRVEGGVFVMGGTREQHREISFFCFFNLDFFKPKI